MVATAFNHMLDALLSAERQARTDSLTGLLNHRAFHERLSHHMTRVQTDGLPLWLLMININDSTLFNDAYGHQVEDSMLSTVATIVQNECRATDVVARYGGDEFVVLMCDANLDHARSLSARIDRAAGQVPIQQLVSEVQRNRGTQFDPDLSDLFVAKLVAAPDLVDARETPAATVAAS